MIILLYVNDSTGYGVAVVKAYAGSGDTRTITMVGNLAGLEIGSGIRAHGSFEKHPRYGEQFKVTEFETVRPASVGAHRALSHQRKYRVSGRSLRAGSRRTSAKACPKFWTTLPIGCAR